MMLLQPTDMSNLGDIAPTTMIEYVAEIDVLNHDVPDDGNLLMIGLQDIATGEFTTNTILIDNEDDGIHPNLFIYDLSFFMSTDYINSVVQDAAKAGGPTHLSILLADVLSNDDTISGSSGIDYINAYAGDDIVHGGSGNDTIDGFSGNDTLMGDAGNDRLVGNVGKDILIGGRGADQFYPYAKTGVGDDQVRDIIHYISLADSGTTAVTRDSIFGFIRGSSGGADRIDLSAIDANPSQPGNQAFHLVTKFTAAHAEVHLVTSGPDTVIQVDGDKDAAVDMTILVHNAHLHAVDLIL